MGSRFGGLGAALALSLLPLGVACQSGTQSTAPTAGPETAVGSGGVNAPQHLDAPYVILWSFDGFRADYVDMYETPNFDAFAAGGMSSEGLIPSFPSMTFPNHYSIATGLYPQHHGLVANDFYDPERDAWFDYHDRSTVEDGSWYSGEPIWVTAEKQGMVSAAYFFVATEADIQGIRPTIWKPFDNSVPNAQRVDSVLAWLQLPEENRPHMITLYVSDVDGAGHSFGPEAPETGAAVARADSLLGRLMQGLSDLPIRDQIYIVLVADHGMAAVDSDRVEYLEDFIDPAEIIPSAVSAYANLFVRGGPDRARELRDQLDEDLQHGRVFLKAEVAPELHFSEGPRVGDLVILMEEGWRIYVDRESGPSPGSGGQHGYVPFLRNMHALFMAWGPDVTSGRRLPSFENVHIYPWLAQVLELEPAETDGNVAVLGGGASPG